MNNMVTWSPGITLEQMEKQIILAAYRHFRGNKTTTAEALGITTRTLYTKLDEYQKEDDIEKEASDARREQEQDFLHRQRGITTTANGNVQVLPTRAQPDGKAGNAPTAGVRMESAVETSKESAVSMPIGKEVQGVSSGKASQSHSGKNR